MARSTCLRHRAVAGLLTGTVIAVAAISIPAAAGAHAGGATTTPVQPAWVLAEALEDSGHAVGATAVRKARCRAGDRVETGLQGQVPVPDRLSGRATKGYSCNLKLIGSFGPSSVDLAHLENERGGFGSFDTYKNCAYYADTHHGDQYVPQYTGIGEVGGTVVLDVSDPREPKLTDYLTAEAMEKPNESLRVNAKRGLLVANRDDQPTGESHALAVYDISRDCARPALLFDGRMPNAYGHEGYFAPDGRTYYMTDGGRFVPPHGPPAVTDLFAIDLADPRHPEEIGPLPYEGANFLHGGSTSLDGKRLYQCEQGTGSVAVLDSSRIQDRRKPASVELLTRILLPNNQWCQATYPLLYDGRAYLVQYGETTALRCPETMLQDVVNFDVPRLIDISDERNPRLISELRLEVDEPANCAKIAADISPRSVEFFPFIGGNFPRPPFAGAPPVDPRGAFVYDVHHCSPDRLIDPTILACAQFQAGLRIYDIRDPERPKELAYYNTGTLGAIDPTVDDAISRPVVRTDLRQVWFTTEFGGFHVVQFRRNVWPFKGQACGKKRDYFFKHYNPRSPCFRGPEHRR